MYRFSWPLYTSGTRRVTHARNTMINHEREKKDVTVTTTNETYLWPPVTTVHQVIMVTRNFQVEDFITLFVDALILDVIKT